MKNLEELPIQNISAYILENQEIRYILTHNPDLRLKEFMRLRYGYEYFGLVLADTVFYVLDKREILFANISIHKATQELIQRFSEYCGKQNNALLTSCRDFAFHLKKPDAQPSDFTELLTVKI